MTSYKDKDYKFNKKTYERMKDIMLKSYVRKIELEKPSNGVSIETHDLPIDKWESCSKYELLNSDRTKFVSN